jgi:hypothetical protein
MLEEAYNHGMPSEQGVEQMFDSCCRLESNWGFLVGNCGLYKVSETKRVDTCPFQLVIRNKRRSDVCKNPTIPVLWSEMASNLDFVLSLVVFI